MSGRKICFGFLKLGILFLLDYTKYGTENFPVRTFPYHNTFSPKFVSEEKNRNVDPLHEVSA